MAVDLLHLLHLLPRPLAFVLGGGGARGAVQLGMLEALADTDLRPDLVVGTSAGALNGAILAASPDTAAQTLATVWSQIDGRDVFPGGLVLNALMATSTKRSYVFDPTPLSDLLAEHLPVSRIEDLAVPFVAMATDLDSGVAVELDSGDLRSALLASSAIPAAFPWVERDGRRLVDGGLVANVPVRQAISRGAKSVLVLDCGSFGAPGRWSEGVLGVLVQAYAIASRQQITADLALAADHPIVYLPVPDSLPTTVFDFSSGDVLTSTAREASTRALAALAERECGASVLPPGLYGHPPLSILNPEVAALQRV